VALSKTMNDNIVWHDLENTQGPDEEDDEEEYEFFFHILPFVIAFLSSFLKKKFNE
jgi:hypothetical protein